MNCKDVKLAVITINVGPAWRVIFSPQTDCAENARYKTKDASFAITRSSACNAKLDMGLIHHPFVTPAQTTVKSANNPIIQSV